MASMSACLADCLPTAPRLPAQCVLPWPASVLELNVWQATLPLQVHPPLNHRRESQQPSQPSSMPKLERAIKQPRPASSPPMNRTKVYRIQLCEPGVASWAKMDSLEASSAPSAATKPSMASLQQDTERKLVERAPQPAWMCFRQLVLESRSINNCSKKWIPGLMAPNKTWLWT
jgi:hypothetical protein